MGRMKSLQPTEAGIHNLFSVRYRRLIDENNSNNNQHNNNQQQQNNNNNNNAQLVVQNLIRMKLSQDYIAYCCGQCGHHQRFDIKADELHNIGDALRMSCTKAPSADAAAAAAATASTTTLVLSTTTSSDAKLINLPSPTVKNGHTTWTRQFHDKNRQHSKANNIEKSAALVEAPEHNLVEMSKCKCSKDTTKTLIKGSAGGNAGEGRAPGIGAALVMPFHSHHPVMMGYKPLLSSIDFSASGTPTSAKPSTHSCNSSVGTSSCSSSRSASPSSASDGYLPTLPVRTDSLTNLEEEALLKCAPWFQAGIPREISLEILQQEPVGSFLVRESTSKPGCYALSVRVPKECQKPSIAHYLITQTNRGFKIKGFTKEFPSLTSLIVHHSVMQELLPCPLLLHRPSSGLLADYLEHANNFVDIDSSVLLELTRKKGIE
ncbi:myb-like protein Q [Daphnia carinata]|uniref:myb-like protein Q n=1 Tax=Daphnia carinata TaxID=120202 RepID=UPI00257D2E9C|nr:myb-like protein Q [Daphnia carinata]XP_059352142.1 myb-like protein Q [Daphnia carinata]